MVWQTISDFLFFWRVFFVFGLPASRPGSSQASLKKKVFSLAFEKKVFHCSGEKDSFLSFQKTKTSSSFEIIKILLMIQRWRAFFYFPLKKKTLPLCCQKKTTFFSVFKKQAFFCLSKRKGFLSFQKKEAFFSF